MATSKATESVNIATHPDYDYMLPVWQKMRDCQNERLVKQRDDADYRFTNSLGQSVSTKRYLPKTSGQRDDNIKGEADYQAKKTRAEFPSNLIDTERAMMGLLNKNKLVIELPEQMQGYIDKITDDGEGINALKARINEEQIIVSRVGLLGDISKVERPGQIPYVALFSAERIKNWSTFFENGKEKYEFVILDVSGYDVDHSTGKWTEEEKYLVLNLDEEGYYYAYETKSAQIDLSTVPEDAKYPVVNGRKAEEIPFVICNASDIKPCVQDPIMEPQADTCLKYYRNDADYQELIFMQTIAIPCFTGLTNTEMEAFQKEISVYNAFASTNKDAKCSFAEVSGNGLSEARTALENTKKDMVSRGISLMEAGANESGEALSIRLTTKTANLSTIDNTAADAIQKMLRIIARWSGNDDSKVKITSNNDFTDATITADDLVKLSDLVDRGSFTREDYFNEIKRSGKTKFDTFDEWSNSTEAVNIGIEM